MKKIGLKTILFTLVFFGFTYMLLVFTNRAGRVPYIFAGCILLVLGIYLFYKSQRIEENMFLSNLLAIFSGISFWGFFGEFMENADLYIKDATVEIAHWNFLPILLFMIFLFLYLRKYLLIPIQFSLASFLLIWTLHYIMIFQFEVLSRTHFSTYFICGIFVLLLGFSIYKVKVSEEINSKMFWSYLGLLTAWSILEYIWSWRLIPGPYSI